MSSMKWINDLKPWRQIKPALEMKYTERFPPMPIAKKAQRLAPYLERLTDLDQIPMNELLVLRRHLIMLANDETNLARVCSILRMLLSLIETE